MTKYVFDNGPFSIILRHYYRKQFSKFWENFEYAISEEIIISAKEVFTELSDYFDDSQLSWLNLNKSIFFPPSFEEGEFIQEIFRVKHFQDNINKKHMMKGSPVADPFVISKGKLENRIVVTQERFTPNAAKIPNICKHFGILFTNLQGFMQQEGWNF